MHRVSILIILALIFMSGCCKGRGYITSEEGGIIGIEINVPVGKEKAEQEEKAEVTFEQKKELATIVGIILPGMTKQEVLETFGMPPRKIGKSLSADQEVWYYKSPEEQIIYFSGDEVDRVRYLPEKKVEVKDVEWL